jgi:hypothetical protein
LAAEWHPDLNAELTAFDVKPRSQRKVWWKCPHGHEWNAQVAPRPVGIGCPKCSTVGASEREIRLAHENWPPRTIRCRGHGPSIPQPLVGDWQRPGLTSITIIPLSRSRVGDRYARISQSPNCGLSSNTTGRTITGQGSRQISSKPRL